MFRTTFKLLSFLSLPILATACSGIGDIDRTQPDKVKKSTFFESDGKTPSEYYYRQTIIDVPATSSVSFIGEQGDTERVVFEVTEDFLFAHRSYGWLPNDSEDGAVPGNQGDGYARPGTEYQGTPIAAFAIQSHFDIQRQYNPQTGEQTNVLMENATDRPWYQREYMRVDWSTNHISDFRFGSATVLQTPASIDVPQEDGLDENKERAQIGHDYIDTVTRLNVEPQAYDFRAYGYGMVPMCYFSSNLFQDCLGGTLKVRNSFRRVEKSDYMPMAYSDLRMQKFGFFRTERFAYNDEYGVVEPAQTRLANRWNIWKDAADCYDAASDKPYATCKPNQLRTIVYYLNEDFPRDNKVMVDMAKDNADEWNRVFRQAVLDSTGWQEADLGSHRMFTLCANNPVKKGDPKECGETGTNPQIGDLRYSMYYYVPNFQMSSPLGYGPSAADPLTGQIIAANAFYYGQAGATIAARTRDSIKLQLGLIQEEDITGGLPAQQAVAAARGAAADTRADQYKHIANAAQRARELAQKLKIKDHADRLNAMVNSGAAEIDRRPQRLAAAQASGLGSMLVTDEIREAFGTYLLDEGVNPDDATKVMATRLLDDGVLFAHAEERMRRLLSPRANGCILMAEDVFDEALLGFTDKVKQKFYDNTGDLPVLKNGFTEQDVYNYILANTMGDTQLHEVGHTVGLRHNFSGSTDALNFGPKYWELKGFVVPQGGDRPAKDWELDGTLQDAMSAALDAGLRDQQGSTTMDYASTYGTVLGLGTYDLAAIKYAYGDQVELFNSTDITDERAALLRQGELHYTFYPEVVSNAGTYADRVTAMYDRRSRNYRNVEETEVEVPYSFCSDEYRDASATCAIWDVGADNYERTVYMTNQYKNYALFNIFKRERLTFGLDVYAYLSRVYSREFKYILNQYKNWVNDELIIRRGRECKVIENGNITTFDPDRFQADPCGLPGLLGAIEAVNFFGDILQSPDVGCYVRLEPGCYDTVAGNAALDSVAEDPDITLVNANPNFCNSYTPTQPANPQTDRRVALKITNETQYVHVQNSLDCSQWESPNDFYGQPVEIPFSRGVARPANTLYDRSQYGYYFYNKPLVMGSWWDKWLAIKAFGDPETDFIGVDASSDTRSFLISLNTLFADDIQNMIGASVTNNVNRFGPLIGEDGTSVQLTPLIPLTELDKVNRTGRAPINPDNQYTFRLLAMYNAAYNGQYTDNYEFGESLQVGAAYNLSNVDIPQAVLNDPSRFTSVTDPVSGMVWYAFHQQRNGGEDLYSIGFEFIREIKDRYYVGGADGPGTEFLPTYRGGAEFAPRQDLEILRIMSTTARVFGWADVWSGELDL